MIFTCAKTSHNHFERIWENVEILLQFKFNGSFTEQMPNVLRKEKPNKFSKIVHLTWFRFYLSTFSHWNINPPGPNIRRFIHMCTWLLFIESIIEQTPGAIFFLRTIFLCRKNFWNSNSISRRDISLLYNSIT